MKLNPMSPKIAAVILLATTGATLSINPAQAAEEIPVPVTQTIDKYDLASFQAPFFTNPPVVSWAVAYTPNIPAQKELDPAEKALLTDGANLAQKQKTVLENNAALVRAELQRIAEEKAAADKIEADKAAAAKAAADKAEAEKIAAAQAAEQAAAQQAAAEQAAAAQAQEVARVTAQQAAAYAPANTGYQAGSGTVAPQSAAESVAYNAPASAANVPASSGIGAALVASAYSQIGINQDCTAMVERALRSIGKNAPAGSLAPLQFLRFGTVVTDPQPGDLMVRAGHVAIYVGNGMAISGGFNGGHTELHPASYLAGSVFVRVS